MSVTKSRIVPPAHRAAIRQIFLQRRPEYTPQQLATLLRMNLGEVLTLIHHDVLHAEVKRKKKQLGGARHTLIAWSEVASYAMVRWTVMQIHDALGEHAQHVLPRLLWPQEVEAVRLPLYQVRLLESLAARDGVSIEEFLFGSLLHLETTVGLDEIERLLPGYGEAMEFPHV